MAELFETCTRAHYEGRITLGDYFKRVRPVLERVCAKLLKRWTPSCAVELEDVVQEAMIGCIWSFKHYEPGRVGKDGRPIEIEDYVMYNSCDKAKKWLHRQRGANRHGNADSAPSRYAQLFEDIAARRSRHSDEPMEIELLSELLQAKPDQDLAMERKQTWRQILEAVPTVPLRWGVMALENARGDRDAAARLLYQNVELRAKLRLGSERVARQVVSRAMRYFEQAEVRLDAVAA